MRYREITEGLQIPEFLYHGTSEKYLAAMLRDGLKPCSALEFADKHVMATCLTDEIEAAKRHAHHMADWEDEPPIVWRIRMSTLNKNLFVVDYNFLKLGPSGSGRGKPVYTAMGHEKWQQTKWTWISMLKICGVVAYTGIIPVSQADLLKGF